MADSISLAQARRIALAAQGFTDPRPTGAITVRHLRRVLGRTGLLQVDSVNVLQRAHYLPLFSRLGPYPTGLLDRAAWRAPRELFEYWGHEASLIPVALHPYLRWRMARARDDAWGGMKWVADSRPELVARVLDEVKARGPMTAGEIEAAVAGSARGPKVHWGWNWSDTKRAIEWLFYSGEVTAAARNGAFARLYDLPERVLPTAILDAPTPTEPDAMRELVRVAAAALGVAGEVDLRDYFRLPVQGARRAVAELTEAGVLRPVEVEGWKPQGYLYAEAKLPRRVHAAAEADPRVLRAALPARRGVRGPRRPQGRPEGRRPAHPGRVGRSRSPAGRGGGGAGRRTAPDGGLARARRGGPARPGRPGHRPCRCAAGAAARYRMSVTHAVGHPHPHPRAEPDGEAAPPPPYPHPVYYVPQPNRFTRFFLRLYDRSPRWAAPAAIAACFAGTAAGVWALNPAAAGADYVSTCVIKMTTGLDCPGCGGTRAFYYLLQGNVPEAARHHVMAVFAAPFLVWLYVAWSVRHIWGKQIPYPKITTKVIGIYLAAWFVFMVVRNLPFAPFTALYV